MTILQTKFHPIPVVIENITASAHITYYAHITPSYGLHSVRLGFTPTLCIIYMSNDN